MVHIQPTLLTIALMQSFSPWSRCLGQVCPPVSWHSCLRWRRVSWYWRGSRISIKPPADKTSGWKFIWRTSVFLNWHWRLRSGKARKLVLDCQNFWAHVLLTHQKLRPLITTLNNWDEKQEIERLLFLDPPGDVASLLWEAWDKIMWQVAAATVKCIRHQFFSYWNQLGKKCECAYVPI